MLKKNLMSLIPFSLWSKLTNVKFIVPYYQLVSDTENILVNNLFKYKNTVEFKKDLDFLLKKYSPISLFDFIDYIRNGKKIPDNAFLLTFNKAYIENYEIVSPILLEKGIPATFFIPISFLDNTYLSDDHKINLIITELKKNTLLTGKIDSFCKEMGIEKSRMLDVLWLKPGKSNVIISGLTHLIGLNYEEILKKYKPFFTTDNVKSLINKGFTIGSHGLTYKCYSNYSLEEQINETKESFKILKEKFNINYNAFAIPYTDHDITKAFFENISSFVDISFGSKGMFVEPAKNHIQRIDLQDSKIPAKKILTFQYSRRFVKQLFNKHIAIRP
jgi:peptidoglycan/xylan/chitin deacetylase (PgdA/CDA1 family)